MTLVAEKRRTVLGAADPRLAPPVPAKSLVKDYKAAAKDLDIELMPWQLIAARFLTQSV
jgi:hypothetical protein